MVQSKKSTSLLGICMSATRNRIVKGAMFNQVSERLRRFQSNNVRIILFSLEDLYLQDLHVTGFYFDNKSRVWKKKMFPIPDVIYMRCGVDKLRLRKMEQVIGRKVFNNFFYDKWQGWNLLAGSDLLRHHLPDTRLVKNEMDLQQMLKKFKDVFLKPISGYGGMGIAHALLKEEGNIQVIYQNKEHTSFKTFEDCKTLWNWIHAKLSPNPYIAQQGIHTFPWKEKPTDIRLNMNKNGKGEWQVTALFSRIALNGSHIGGDRGIQYMPLDIRELLSEMFYDDDDRVEYMEKYIVELGFKICKVLDDSGYHIADIGIDLGIDECGRLWTFEVNPSPCPFGPPIEDLSWTMPFEYALYLASK